MWIFADWLKDYHPVIHIKDNSLTIDTIRLFSENTPMNHHTLYIGKAKDFFDSSENCVFCAHQNDQIILPTDDIGEILNKVLEAIDFYSRWNSEILELISGGCMIEDILKHSEQILKEPVFVLDSGQRLLAMSSQFDKGQVDTYWDELREYGSTNLDFILYFNQTYAKKLFQKHGIYLVEEKILPHKAYCYNFFLKGVWIGVTNLLVLNSALSQGTIDLFSIFCHYADMWFESHSQQQSLLFLDSLFHFALSDQKCDYEYFSHHLNLLNWQNDDPKVLITMANLSQEYNIHTHLCHTINDLFPYAYAITHNNYVCALCNLRQKNLNAIFQDFTPWLKKSGYYGCCSSSFQKLYLLSEHFKQAEITARLCPGEAGKIYNFQNYMVRYGFSVMKQHIHTNLIHPAVTQLLEYDTQNHTYFSHTLYMYIRYERSQSHTAAALNVHRNTLTYRLNRLRELISCDLDIPEVRLHILVSYELLKLEEGKSHESSRAPVLKEEQEHCSLRSQ